MFHALPAMTLSATRSAGARRGALAGLCLIPMIALGARAQTPDDLTDMSLEDLLQVEIVTATRFQQTVAQAPSSVQVITAQDIRAHGWRTLAEALDSLPGLYVSDTGLYTYLGARGHLRAGDYDTRFLLLINGHRINDPVYSQSPVGAEFPLDMSLVERIEYAPGPGSALYGSNAFFGVINVLTKDTGSFGNGELRMAVGSYGTSDAQFTLPLASSDRSTTLLSARRYHSEGRTLRFTEWGDTPSGGVVRDQDDERVRQVFAHHAKGDLSVQLVAGDRRKEDPVAPYDQAFATPGAQVQDRWITFGAAYTHRFQEVQEASVRLDVVDYRYVGDYVYDPASPYLNRDVATGTSVVVGGQVLARFGQRHTVVAGVEATVDQGVVQRNFDIDPRISYLHSRENMSTWGVFVDDDIRLSDRLRVNSGLRADKSDAGTWRLSPRFALIATPEEGTVLKLIAGQSYRSPNAYERYYQVDAEESAQFANPALGAEHMQTTELHYSRAVGARGRADISAYQYRLRDLITLVEVEDGVLTLANHGHASSRGAELAYVYQGNNGFRMRASHAYSEVSDSETRRPVNAPTGITRLAASMPLPYQWKVAASAQRVSSRASLDGSLPAYTTVNAHLSWQPDGLPLSVSMGVRNLLDESYGDPVGPEFVQDVVPRRGREYRLEARWTF